MRRGLQFWTGEVRSGSTEATTQDSAPIRRVGGHKQGYAVRKGARRGEVGRFLGLGTPVTLLEQSMRKGAAWRGSGQGRESWALL